MKGVATLPSWPAKAEVSFDAVGNTGLPPSLEWMARYFFHTANGTMQHDGEGLELATMHAAELEAVRFLGDLLSEQPGVVSSSQVLTITVTDAGGRVAFSVKASMSGPQGSRFQA